MHYIYDRPYLSIRIIEVNEQARITPNWDTKQHFFHTFVAIGIDQPYVAMLSYYEFRSSFISFTPTSRPFDSRQLFMCWEFLTGSNTQTHSHNAIKLNQWIVVCALTAHNTVVNVEQFLVYILMAHALALGYLRNRYIRLNCSALFFVDFSEDRIVRR